MYWKDTDAASWAAHEMAGMVDADPVRTLPTGVGSADVKAPAADGVVREVPGGIALRRGHR